MGLESFDVSGPLLAVVRQFGDRVLDPVETSAKQSAAIRLAIWSVRNLNRGDRSTAGVPADVWVRFLAAAGDTNPCNTRLPQGVAHRLEPIEEQAVEAWFGMESTFWAWEVLAELVGEDPEQAWETILAIVSGSESDDERGYCGAGPLEDLIRAHPERFIRRTEDLAARDPLFQQALAAAWITLEDVPEPLARRYLAASGGGLRILDAPNDSSP